MKTTVLKIAEKLGAVCTLALAAVVAFSLNACNKEPEEKTEPIVFPALQEKSVQANTTETLTFSINADWTLTSDAAWALFDGEWNCSGTAGENISVELTISDLDQSLEETSTANLTLTAGEESQVIFTIYRAPAGVTLTVTYTNEDGEEEEVTEITAGWSDYITYTITANFEFAVSDQPDWVVTKEAVTGSDGNPATAQFKCIDDYTIYKYSQSGVITFANEAGTITYPFDITFSGMDYDGIDFAGPGQWNWQVTKDGKTITQNGQAADPSFTIICLNDDYVIANADYTDPENWKFYVDSKYDSNSKYNDSGANWTHIASDDGKGNVTLSFDETEEARTEFVFSFPRGFYEELIAGADGLNAIYDEDGDIIPNYEYYAIAAIEQTTKTGNEKFAINNGTSQEDIPYEEDCPEGLDVSSVLADYPDAFVGYLPYEIGTTYITTVLPLEKEQWWICDATVTDCYGNNCRDLDEYEIEGSETYYIGGTAYCCLSVTVTEDPDARYFYAVFNDPDNAESDTWILFFYDLEATDPSATSLILSIKHTSSSSFTFCLPVYSHSGGVLNCTVDWGDGTVETITEDAPEHTYEQGTYTVTVSGTVPRFGNGGSGKSGFSNYLQEVLQWGKLDGLTSLSGAFNNCSITTLPETTGKTFSGVTDFSYAFYNCSSLQSVPSDLFAKSANATDFSYAFYNCSKLQSIPSDLFAISANATDFSFIFNGCTTLTTIPSGLFDNCPAAENFASVFNGCIHINTIPSGLFANNVKATSFANAFTNCGSKEDSLEIGSGLFSNCTAAESFLNVFKGCTTLTTLPDNLFAGLTKVTTFSDAFNGCTALTTLGSGLFTKAGSEAETATVLSNLFYGCTALTSIPSDTFSGLSTAATMNNLFYNCSALTSIPEDLFKDCTAATTFGSAFYGCSGITEIPAGLFKYNTAVTEFTSTFQKCTGLTTIPTGLFDANTEATTFTSVFNGCTGLTSLPASLFDKNTKLNAINNGFNGCTSLECESPYTEYTINGETTKIHLYERVDHAEDLGYPTSISHLYCFKNCTKLTDHAAIYAAGWCGCAPTE